MRRLVGVGLRLLVAGVLAMSFAASPAAAMPVAAQCVLEPGVYGVIDSQGRVVALLIVYPDCRTEVWQPSNVM